MKTPVIGQPVWFYADRAHVSGMTRVDDTEPFAAIVVAAPHDRLVNVLVFDHIGATFPMQSVALYQGDDKDDKTALCHCELEPPAPKETIELSGAAGQPTALNLGATITASEEAGATIASVKLTFTVPPGETYRFFSEAAALDQSFTASPKPQTLMPTPAQIAAGALTDLSITTANEGDVMLAVAVVELKADGTIGKKHTFNESVAVGPAVPLQPEVLVPTPAPVVATKPKPAPAPAA